MPLHVYLISARGGSKLSASFSGHCISREEAIGIQLKEIWCLRARLDVVTEKTTFGNGTAVLQL
jgi:hypothetical protein